MGPELEANGPSPHAVSLTHPYVRTVFKYGAWESTNVCSSFIITFKPPSPSRSSSPSYVFHRYLVGMLATRATVFSSFTFILINVIIFSVPSRCPTTPTPYIPTQPPPPCRRLVPSTLSPATLSLFDAMSSLPHKPLYRLPFVVPYICMHIAYACFVLLLLKKLNEPPHFPLSHHISFFAHKNWVIFVAVT